MRGITMERITATLSCTIMTENEHLYFAKKCLFFFSNQAISELFNRITFFSSSTD